jgi:hypothetical protein
MSEISRFSWYPHFNTFFRHFIRRCRLPYMWLNPHSFALIIVSYVSSTIFIDIQGLDTSETGKKQRSGQKRRRKAYIRQSAMPKKIYLKNVLKCGYHENRDISAILKYFEKSSWIRKEGWTGCIFLNFVFHLRGVFVIFHDFQSRLR